MIRRLSSFMVALWFALYVGAPQLLHPCPQHAVPESMGAAMRHHAAMGVAGERANAPAAATHAYDAQRSRAPPAPAQDHRCCCPGPQCGSAVVVVAPTATWIDVTLVATTVAPVAPRVAPPPTRFAHTLPYATAPPTAREA